MNNKLWGSMFEKRFVEFLRKRGWWVHFLSPNNGGAQPFDIIAARNGRTFVFDCKTSEKPVFPFSRLENNQVLAFEKWVLCGNEMPRIAILYNDRIYTVPYDELKYKLRIDLQKEVPLDEDRG